MAGRPEGPAPDAIPPNTSRRSSLFGHSLQLRAPCRKDWLFVRKEALVYPNAAALLGGLNAQFVARQLKVANLLAAFVKIVRSSIDLRNEFGALGSGACHDSRCEMATGE
jgi:hypothetical protein